MTRRPLHSHHLGVLTFWTLALFGSWGGVAAASPLPAWLPALSTVAAVLTVVPIIAVALNLRRTVAGDWGAFAGMGAGRFILFGAAAYVIAGLAAALNSLQSVSVITNFTWVTPALTQLGLYGFFAMSMFGAIYYIVPRLMGAELSPRLAGAHFWLAALGVLLYVVPLVIGGLNQGGAMNVRNTAFLDVVLSTLPVLAGSTTGDLLLAMGHLVLFLNLAGLLYRVGRAAVCAAVAGNRIKAAEVAS